MQGELRLREGPAIAGTLKALSSSHGDDTKAAGATTAFALPSWAESMCSTHGGASRAQAQ